MLDRLEPSPVDSILSLMQEFRDDPRERKIDVGVGIFRDDQGKTPVMRAVRAAEARIVESETTKEYTSLVGDPEFAEAMVALALDGAVERDRIAAAATTGGSNAVRQAFEMARMANASVRIFVPVPTWPNHLSILAHLGIEAVTYRYLDRERGTVDFAGMMADLAQAGPDDAVLLQGCCHNPSGADLDLQQWTDAIGLLARNGPLAIVDIAYQGLGDGVSEDAAGVRALAAGVPECLVAASCSKNFGLYRERAGILLSVSETSRTREASQGAMAHLNRQSFSFPPDRGGRIVTEILLDDELRADWEAELESMRQSIRDLRRQLADELRRISGSGRHDALASHRGMFSLLDASPEQVRRLREEHGIYMVPNGRINVSGLNGASVPVFASALADTLGIAASPSSESRDAAMAT